MAILPKLLVNKEPIRNANTTFKILIVMLYTQAQQPIEQDGNTLRASFKTVTL